MQWDCFLFAHISSNPNMFVEHENEEDPFRASQAATAATSGVRGTRFAKSNRIPPSIWLLQEAAAALFSRATNDIYKHVCFFTARSEGKEARTRREAYWRGSSMGRGGGEMPTPYYSDVTDVFLAESFSSDINLDDFVV